MRYYLKSVCDDNLCICLTIRSDGKINLDDIGEVTNKWFETWAIVNQHLVTPESVEIVEHGPCEATGTWVSPEVAIKFAQWACGLEFSQRLQEALQLECMC